MFALQSAVADVSICCEMQQTARLGWPDLASLRMSNQNEYNSYSQDTTITVRFAAKSVQ